MDYYNQLRPIANSIKSVGCLCFIIILTSCAPSATDTASRPTDNSAILASLIKTSNLNIEGLNVNTDDSDPANPKLAITGLTNSASGDPVTATINIDQDKGITTDPTSFTVTAPAVISPHEQETNLMVTFGSEPAVSYTVTTQIRGAAVSEWLTSETISTYVKATFTNKEGIVALAETTISVAGLTNSSAGEAGMITIEGLPAGFTSDSPTIEIPDPDGTGTAGVMSTPNPNTFKITETGNTGNSVTYTINDIELAQLNQFAPGTHIKITEGSSTEPVSGLTITEEAGNVIRIVGLTNKEEANTYTLAIAQVDTIFTISGGGPITRTIAEPTIDFSGGAGTVTDGGTAAPTFEITNVGESATTYTLEVVFTEVAVNEWFPAKFDAYITGASFAGQAANTLALNEGTIAISHSASANNFTNVPNGMIVFTEALPDGYELVATDLKDPDGEMRVAVTDGDAGMITITETGNTANSQTYTVTITLASGVQLSITSTDVTGSPLVINSGATIPITTGVCELLAAPMLAAAGFAGSKVADTTPFPLYYDRERDASNNNKYTVTRTLILEDSSGGGLHSNFNITMEFPACTSFPSGQTGADEANAYQIDSAPMLDLASHLVNTDNANYGNKYYKVMGNIDMGLAGLPLSEIGSGSVGKGFNPIGMSRNLGFTGAIDCDNKEISNLYVNRDSADNLGLFGYALNATIANCRLITVKITGRSSVGGLVGVNNSSMISNSRATGVVVSGTTNVGGLVGVSTTNSTITNSYAIGSVTGSDMSMHIGGLVGRNINSVIKGSHADGQIIAGNSEVGGLVGGNDTGSMISESYATVSINATSNVGGLVGSNNASTINGSYATGAVRGTSLNVGGLVGWALSSSISKSYATGAVTGTTNVGGLVGFNSIMSAISDSYATGAVIGSDYVGGLAGYNYFMSTITNAYTTGSVTGSVSVGLFIGYNGEGNPVAPTGNGVTASYFRSDAVLTVGGSVLSTPIGIGSDDATATPPVMTANLTGQTTAELQSGTAYSGWDATTIWEFTSGQYPRLR